MTATSSTSSKTPTTTSGGSKSKKKKKKTKAGVVLPAENDLDHHGAPGDYGTQKIWNTTTAEEKERIKEFWLGLSEQERRNLVRVEKEHVSKRVKEGSKILNCSCHVCGRKQYDPFVMALIVGLPSKKNSMSYTMRTMRSWRIIQAHMLSSLVQNHLQI
jgi:hypothetical protein